MALPLLKDRTKEAANSNKPQYDVYIYHHPANTNEEIHDWERKSSTANMRRALLKAKNLHQSQKYQRVEVKKRKFDAKNSCTRSSIFRVYDAEPNNKGLYAVLAFAAVISIGVLGFLLYLA